MSVIIVSKEKEVYNLVDQAIAVIQASGIKHQVCPFETVLEGNYDDIMQTVKAAQKACFDAGADEVLVNMKVQNRKNAPVTIHDKMQKYS